MYTFINLNNIDFIASQMSISVPYSFNTFCRKICSKIKSTYTLSLSACPPLLWGAYCNQTCGNCLSQCNYINGYCLTGCSQWYTDDSCTTEIGIKKNF